MYKNLYIILKNLKSFSLRSLLLLRETYVVKAGQINSCDLLVKFHVMGFCRNYLATGFREDFPSVRLCGLKERKVTLHSAAPFFTKMLVFVSASHVAATQKSSVTVPRPVSCFSGGLLPTVGTFFPAFCRLPLLLCLRGLARLLAAAVAASAPC